MTIGQSVRGAGGVFDLFFRFPAAAGAEPAFEKEIVEVKFGVELRTLSDQMGTVDIEIIIWVTCLHFVPHSPDLILR